MEFLVPSILLKKRTKKIQLNYYDSFRSFFGRIEDTKKTFKTEKILVLNFDPRFTQVHIVFLHPYYLSDSLVAKFLFLCSINTFEAISIV